MDDRTADLVIVPATAADLDAVVRLEERAFTADRISRRAWRHLVTRAHADVLVARARGHGGLLGSAAVLYRRGSAVARLYSLATDPDARGRGVARALLDAVIERARFRGCERLGLEVRADNAPALALYRAAGFEEVRPLPDYYADGAPGLRMERRL